MCPRTSRGHPRLRSGTGAVAERVQASGVLMSEEAQPMRHAWDGWRTNRAIGHRRQSQPNAQGI